jgi:cytochrome c556
MRISRALACVSLMLAILVGGLPAALAADEPENIIKYRRNVMKAVGANMGNLAMFAKGNITFADNIVANARGIREGLAMAEGLFPESTETGETNALPKLWEDKADFEAALRDSIAAADAMVTAAGGGAIPTVIEAFRALGKTCGGCHKPYRKKH